MAAVQVTIITCTLASVSFFIFLDTLNNRVFQLYMPRQADASFVVFAFGRFSRRFLNQKASQMAGLTGFRSFMPNLSIPEFHPFSL